MDEAFWDGAAYGALGALSEGINEPFGVWPCPSMPQPKPLRAVLPITVSKPRS